MAHSDVNFVHSLYAQANSQVNKKVNHLFIFIVVFVSFVLIWASISEIDELARGEGKVIPSEKIQTLQSLDGGVISEILVSEGDHVIKGQPLMRIDTTRFRASLEENRQAYLSLIATKSRLEAEYNFNPKEEFKALVFPRAVEEEAKEYAISENKLYNTRIDEFRSSLMILENQLGQKVQELVELKNKKKQLDKNLKLTKDEMKTIERLVKKGAKSNIELISIQKEYGTLEGDLQAASLSIPRIELSIKEAQNKIIEKVKNFKSEAANELQKKLSELKKYESKLVSESDKLDKTVIKSSVNGVIKTIHLNTIGGVVKSGVDLIEVVPDSDILFVEAKIDPKDIAFINPSQEVIVKITAYDFSIYGALEGEIREISADSIKDEDSKDGKTYYKVIVETDKNYLEKDGKKLYIIPGMIASVDIITGKKTILDFILKPILKTKQSALHER